MWARILTRLPVAILVLAGSLVLSTALGYVVDLGSILPIEIVRFYTALVLIGLSIILAVLNLLLTSHPFYEYWLVIMLGGAVGLGYLA